jgi:hypothetical protein
MKASARADMNRLYGPRRAVQDRAMMRFVGLAVPVLCLLGCGLRSDPDYSPVCVDDSIVAGDTGGTGDTGDTGTPVEPRYGSCDDPIDLPAGQTIVVRGSLGGCSGTQGWCGGTGAEDVYRIGSVSGDVFVDFLPQETNFNPVLRVIRGEDPCVEAPLESTEVCAAIKNSVPGRGFFDQGVEGETYYIIVDTELGESGEYAFEVRFGDEAFAGDCLDALDEQAIELATGGNFVWEADLEDEQGRVDSSCSAPGNDDIFALVLTGGGTLQATVEVLEGDIQPIVSVRTGCGTSTELTCGPTVSTGFGSSSSAYLVVDQLGAANGRYRLTVDYF